jgi:hypothetical protein
MVYKEIRQQQEVAKESKGSISQKGIKLKPLRGFKEASLG